MWLCLNHGFYSIVAHKGHPGMMLVRARRYGDLDAAFPGHEVKDTPGADYRYRVVVPRGDVMAWLLREFDGVTYPNFKASVRDDELHDAYFDVWHRMRELQP